ncbi:MAG: hypothetical protein ACI9OB_000382, partial [Nonlabens sp.]
MAVNVDPHICASDTIYMHHTPALAPTLASQLAAPTSGDELSMDVVVPLRRAVEDVHGSLESLVRAWLSVRAAGGIAAVAAVTATEWAVYEARLPRWIASQLESVADRMEVVPHIAAMFWDHTITFDDLVDLVRMTGPLSGPLLAFIDEQTELEAARLAEHNELHALCDTIRFQVEQLRAPGWAQRQDRRMEHGSTVVTQQDFDGGGMIYGQLTPLDFTPVVTALEAKAGPPSPDMPRSQQRANALVDICTDALSGGATTPARPTMVVSIDIATATSDRFADLLRIAGGTGAPRLSARIIESLAHNAKLLLHITDGRNPLAEIQTDDISHAVRRAVTTRDKGCRKPGCTAPARQCDIHHILPRAAGGTHVPSNLMLACRKDHRSIDTVGWIIHHNPKTARITWTH